MECTYILSKNCFTITGLIIPLNFVWMYFENILFNFKSIKYLNKFEQLIKPAKTFI